MPTKISIQQIDCDKDILLNALGTAESIVDYDALRSYIGAATIVRISSASAATFFVRNGIELDNNNTVIQDGFGRSWEKLFTDTAIGLDTLQQQIEQYLLQNPVSNVPTWSQSPDW